MLRVIVESASGIPKKKLGNPDPIAAIVFRGERCHRPAYSFNFLPFIFRENVAELIACHFNSVHSFVFSQSPRV